jgi:hypothetical protein
MTWAHLGRTTMLNTAAYRLPMNSMPVDQQTDGRVVKEM